MHCFLFSSRRKYALFLSAIRLKFGRSMESFAVDAELIRIDSDKRARLVETSCMFRDFIVSVSAHVYVVTNRMLLCADKFRRFFVCWFFYLVSLSFSINKRYMHVSVNTFFCSIFICGDVSIPLFLLSFSFHFRSRTFSVCVFVCLHSFHFQMRSAITVDMIDWRVGRLD